MVKKKGPKTLKGLERKMITGNGRRSIKKEALWEKIEEMLGRKRGILATLKLSQIRFIYTRHP